MYTYCDVCGLRVEDLEEHAFETGHRTYTYKGSTRSDTCDY